MTKPKLFIAVDDKSLQKVLNYKLVQEGYQIHSPSGSIKILEQIRHLKPNLAILDMTFPYMDGLKFCRIIRREAICPILMLTTRDSEINGMADLEKGTNTYVTKPFSIREVIAHVRTILWQNRENNPNHKGTISLDNLTINPSCCHVSLNDKKLTLTPKEYNLLYFLARNKGFIFSREEILEKVWGCDYPGGKRTVDVHIRWLRRKIEDDGDRPKRLVTVHSVGYKLEG